ncbi:MAG: thiamine pyrophosphate-binding protein, partial [Paracoccaceae bacterium]|nr:thiamine pyrophosphate-binding protein [Paracoccaceae bacterium]
PVTEQGRFGGRTVPIGWCQEMRDQAALVREATKWDYELRFPEQVPELVDRALAIATSVPRGPVYVALPREVLCEPCPSGGLDAPPSMLPPETEPGPRAIARLADLIATATNPVIFAQHGAGNGFDALARLAERWAIPVCQYWALQLALPTDHPMAAPDTPGALLESADLVICLDTLAPWMPAAHTPRAEACVVQISQDPLAIRSPIRNFRADLALTCDPGAAILALEAALETREPGAGVARRRRLIEQTNRAARAKILAAAAPDDTPAMTKAQIALALSEALKGRDATVLSELGCPMAPMDLSHARAWYQEPHAGGLGWSFPAAMGMQLAHPDRLIVATMGDGSYMFCNPVVCHQI